MAPFRCTPGLLGDGVPYANIHAAMVAGVEGWASTLVAEAC